jgi:integrase
VSITAPAVTRTQLGYARVSTGHQSLDQQVDALTDAGVDPARLYMDKLSGTSTREQRPGLAALLDYARQGDAIVVVGIDRLGRNAAEAADLAAECGDFDALVLVLAYCGLRFGEATARTRADVHVDRARMEVHTAVERVNGQYRLGPTKTHEIREVPIPPPVLALLRERLSGSPDGLLFPGADGYLKNHEFRKVFDPAATEARVGGLAPHELRHTCASLAIRSADANIKTVQRMLGHATVTMTLDTYGHLYADDLDDVAQRLGAECAYQRGKVC